MFVYIPEMYPLNQCATAEEYQAAILARKVEFVKAKIKELQGIELTDEAVTFGIKHMHRLPLEWHYKENPLSSPRFVEETKKWVKTQLDKMPEDVKIALVKAFIVLEKDQAYFV